MANGSFHPLPDPLVEPTIKTNACYRNTVAFVGIVVSGKKSGWKFLTAMFQITISGVFFALGTLAYWHARIIGKGETSIEYYINKAETQRYAENGLVYQNPYDFGKYKNWRLFLGMTEGR